MKVTLATGADARYGNNLLNLIGSAQANAQIFDRIVAFDLGLTPFQRRLLESARNVEVAEVPPFVPHWREGFTWKTWIWSHVETDVFFWLDAGATVLRPLTDPLAQVLERGYFCVSASRRLAESVPREFFELFGVTEDQAASVSISGGIVGFSRDSEFFRRVVLATHADARNGLTRGFSPAEMRKLNRGLGESADPPIRDCRIFRHDQTLLAIHFYQAITDPIVNDVDEYGGSRSPHDHPEQLIWNHRRRGDYRYLPCVRYTGILGPLGRVWGAAQFAIWWRRRHGWLFRPSTYVSKMRGLMRVRP